MKQCSLTLRRANPIVVRSQKLITIAKEAFPDVKVGDYFTVEMRSEGGSWGVTQDCPVISVSDCEFIVEIPVT